MYPYIHISTYSIHARCRYRTRFFWPLRKSAFSAQPSPLVWGRNGGFMLRLFLIRTAVNEKLLGDWVAIICLLWVRWPVCTVILWIRPSWFLKQPARLSRNESQPNKQRKKWKCSGAQPSQFRAMRGHFISQNGRTSILDTFNSQFLEISMDIQNLTKFTFNFSFHLISQFLTFYIVLFPLFLLTFPSLI